jgi:hypothetical protein
MIGRLEKNVIIARSGVYKYEPQALPGLKVQGVAPDGWESKTYYNVYRPANVVMQAKDKFVKLPLIREHQAIIDGKNFRDYALGWTGDTADIAVLPGSNEIGIQSTVNLIDEEAIRMYDEGFRDVSPLYGASFKWASGKSPDGEDYDIIMDDVIDVNHLAFTKQGRGGPAVAMDSTTVTVEVSEPEMQNVETLPPDTVSLDNVDFRTAIDDMVSNRAEYTADEISAGVDFLHSLIKDIPDSEEKKILARLIDDFLTVKDAFPNDEAAKVAADSVVSRYDSLNAKEDNMGLFSGKAKDAVPEETPAQEAPAKPEAPAPAPAEQAPATDAPVAPVPAAAMEVAQMPDDVTTLDDAGLRACLNGVIKALKALMPEEAAEPEHQGEAPAPAAADGEGEKPPMEEEKKEGAAGDSVFTMSLKSNSGLSVKAKDFFDYLNRSK